jgi:RNA polymerase sigma factor (sigma-70 family)
MTAPLNDSDLVGSYAREGSDSAFRALVTRHVDLVFATALRQVGNRGAAEEITQNVFIALARKAPGLTGFDTIGGWLYRTTILESRARIRADLRRRQREEKAAELAEIPSESSSLFDAMLPLLDEGLLSLRENDRVALISRYIEERPLRDVGSALGVDEDAARKRVSRALDRLARFFQKHGFALPGTAGAAALLAHATQAAPATLAAASAEAALAAGGAATGVNLLLLNLMTLSKTKTAIACLLLAATPLVWQRSTQGHLAEQQALIENDLKTQQETLVNLEAQQTQLNQAILRASTERFGAEAKSAELKKRREQALPPPKYTWQDASALIRIPKSLLRAVPVSAVANKAGTLNPVIKETLQMQENEAGEVQAALDQFLANVRGAEQRTMRQIDPIEDDLRGRKADQTRVFEIGDTTAEVSAARAELFSTLEAVLGAERFQMFRKALSDWMPIDDEEHGVSTSLGIFQGPHRIQFYEPIPGQNTVGWGLSKKGSSLNATMDLGDIPAQYVTYLQDWIQLAQSQPSPESVANSSTVNSTTENK